MKASARALAALDLETALTGCERALKVQEELAAADRSNAEAQQDLAYAHYTSGRIHQLRGEFSDAVSDYRRALDILEPLVRRQPENVETRFDLDRAQKGLVEARAARQDSREP
jgi:tetratricopeptide (TPR) repeat protein